MPKETRVRFATPYASLMLRFKKFVLVRKPRVIFKSYSNKSSLVCASKQLLSIKEPYEKNSM